MGGQALAQIVIDRPLSDAWWSIIRNSGAITGLPLLCTVPCPTRRRENPRKCHIFKEFQHCNRGRGLLLVGS